MSRISSNILSFCSVYAKYRKHRTKNFPLWILLTPAYILPSFPLIHSKRHENESQNLSGHEQRQPLSFNFSFPKVLPQSFDHSIETNDIRQEIVLKRQKVNKVAQHFFTRHNIIPIEASYIPAKALYPNHTYWYQKEKVLTTINARWNVKSLLSQNTAIVRYGSTLKHFLFISPTPSILSEVNFHVCVLLITFACLFKTQHRWTTVKTSHKVK